MCTSGVILGICSMALAAPAAAQVTFTGDADADFSSATAIALADVTGVDVGVPLQAPPGTISGHDIENLRLDFDGNTDTLYVGFDTFVISGDVDGDGADGSSSAWLLGNGGIDIPNQGGGDVAAILLDIDEDGIYDIVGASTTRPTRRASRSRPTSPRCPPPRWA